METHIGVLPVKEEAFWASIIAKWSDACSNIVLLKTELEKAHIESQKLQECIHALRAREEALVGERDRLTREFEKYRELSVTHLQARENAYHSQFQSVSIQSVPSQVYDEVVHSKLREAEDGLIRAKNEYLRIKDQLLHSDEQLQCKDEELRRKDAEIADLTLSKDQLQKNNFELMNEKNSVEAQLISNKAVWENQLAELSRLHDKDKEDNRIPLTQNLLLDTDLDVRGHNFTEVKLERNVASLLQEIDSLKTNAAADKQENAALLEELSSIREKLNKANATNKLLLDNNKTLSENLTRLNEGLKLRESALTASLAASQRDLTLISTPVKQEPTSADPNTPESSSTIKKTDSRVFLCLPPARTDRTPTTSKTVSSQPVSRSVSTWSSLMTMPEARRQTLAQFADYIPDADCADAKFRRTLLASAIGGGIQSLIVRVTQSQTALAKKHDISMYLCPTLELNPWCPTSPGKHGYMFVGLGQERNTFVEPHVGLNVFLGKTRSPSKPKDYYYLGVYTAVRVGGLSVDEWNSLSDVFKTAYSHTTREKNKDARTVEAIRAAYDAGELSVPCVRLRCIDFDEGLFNALAAAHLAPTPPRPPRNAKKRRRDDEDYPAQSRRLSPHESDVDPTD